MGNFTYESVRPDFLKLEDKLALVREIRADRLIRKHKREAAGKRQEKREKIARWFAALPPKEQKDILQWMQENQ